MAPFSFVGYTFGRVITALGQTLSLLIEKDDNE